MTRVTVDLGHADTEPFSAELLSTSFPTARVKLESGEIMTVPEFTVSFD